jgi:hypothetical protein
MWPATKSAASSTRKSPFFAASPTDPNDPTDNHPKLYENSRQINSVPTPGAPGVEIGPQESGRDCGFPAQDAPNQAQHPEKTGGTHQRGAQLSIMTILKRKGGSPRATAGETGKSFPEHHVSATETIQQKSGKKPWQNKNPQREKRR